MVRKKIEISSPKPKPRPRKNRKAKTTKKNSGLLLRKSEGFLVMDGRKRRAVEDSSTTLPVHAGLKDRLLKAWEAANAHQRAIGEGAVELEIKCGAWKDSERVFVPNVGEERFAQVLGALGRVYSWFNMNGGKEELTIDRTYSRTGRSASLRETCDKEGKRTALISKEKLSSETYEIQGSDLALRISVSKETQMFDLPTDFGDEGVWKLTNTRRKWRHRFAHRSGRVVWKVELTKTQENDSADARYEIEFELWAWALKVDPDLRHTWSVGMLNFIQQALQSQGCVLDESLFPDFLSLYTGSAVGLKHPPEMMVGLCKLFLAQFSSVDIQAVATARTAEDFHGIAFPGTMPKAFRRTHLLAGGIFNPKEYKVSEKTDGFRYMLMVCGRSNPQYHGLWLINRNLDFFPLHSPSVPGDQFINDVASKGITILDGEIIKTPPYDGHFHLAVGAPCFCVFDAICIDGESLLHRSLNEREQAILEKIIQPYAERVSELDWPTTKKSATQLSPQARAYMPCFVSRKKQYAPEQFHLLRALIKHSPSQGYMIQEPQEGKHRWKRIHNTDGLVFTHVGPYKEKALGFCWKWKFPELMSVDFLVRRISYRNSLQYVLLAAGEGDDLVSVTAPSMELVENMDDLAEALIHERGAPNDDPFSILEGSASRVITELAFNRKTGRWLFECLRTKLQPNHITIVFDTMQQIAEDPITLEDLQTLLNQPKAAPKIPQKK